MATERQIAANRANAQHCTGPKSEQGKANSSKNSFKTGLDAKSEIIRYEKREDYDALTAEYHNRFRPARPEERDLVDDLIKSERHGHRYHSIDAAVLDRAIQNVPSGSLGAAYTQCADTLSRVERKINSAQRNFQKALKQLMEIQAKRPSNLAAGHENQLAQAASETPETTEEHSPQTTATGKLNQKSVSFLTFDDSTPEADRKPLPSTPQTEENPPIAA